MARRCARSGPGAGVTPAGPLAVAALWIATAGRSSSQRRGSALGYSAAGSALHRAHAGALSWIRTHRAAGAGAGRGREYRGILDDGFRTDPAAAVSRSRTVWWPLGEAAQLPTDGAIARELRGLEAHEQVLRRHGRVLGQVGEPGGARRSGAIGRGGGYRGSVSGAGRAAR